MIKITHPGSGVPGVAKRNHNGRPNQVEERQNDARDHLNLEPLDIVVLLYDMEEIEQQESEWPPQAEVGHRVEVDTAAVGPEWRWLDADEAKEVQQLKENRGKNPVYS